MTIKKMLVEYEKAEDKANRAEDAWENDYENETLEAEFNKAYEEVHKTYNELAAEIVKITNGAIDNKTAGYMIRAKREELKTLIMRIA